MSTFHPCPNDDGDPVHIRKPSESTPLSCWHDPGQLATVLPAGPMPGSLNGIAMTPWTAWPADSAGWSALADCCTVDEPPFVLPAGLAAAAGAVVVEDDGRVWLVAPCNGYGGYAATFPKGRVDGGTSLVCAAIRETFEESGLQVRIEAFLADSRRTQTLTRYYIARRIGGNPSCMGWETQAVHLAPVAQLRQLAVHANDLGVIEALERWLDRHPAP
jgi:ADP-ribose pyrophosphatase YjhB (NUDIX family)